MKFRTEIALAKALNQIDFKSHILILGSCFAQHIGQKFEYYKFQSVQNPLGIVFHPIAVEQLITRAIENKRYTQEDLFLQNERWHCFDAHSVCSDTSPEKLLEKLNWGIEHTLLQAQRASHIIITLGTAWVYRHIEKDHIVANCHKVPQAAFKKELLPIPTIEKGLQKSIDTIRSINKNVHFIFTVSPIRHLKDGFVENQQSKAHLITAIHNVIRDANASINYFPSYEIMLDELRDYRFYKADMLHPNEVAISYIWKRFEEVWITPPALPIMEKIKAIQQGLQHRPFNPKSKEYQSFINSLEGKIQQLKKEYPFMTFDL